ncbi:MAG: hypothetical protein IPH31_19480 [Lewinellaceae bacterium]|nr:hypothetical protein [Lewinellaceae bacterium]
MKRLLAILLIYCTPHLADAQSSVSPDSTFWRFAEISGVIGGFSSKLKVEVNYGENVTGWFKTPEMLTDPITGKPAKFNSMCALNFMQ